MKVEKSLGRCDREGKTIEAKKKRVDNVVDTNETGEVRFRRKRKIAIVGFDRSPDVTAKFWLFLQTWRICPVFTTLFTILTDNQRSNSQKKAKNFGFLSATFY